jgi:transcriptional regulator of acetoin/glycerol metabolism
MSKPEPLVVVERRAIVQALEYTLGNVREASVLLDVPKSTLYRHIKDFMIDLRTIGAQA